MNLEIDRRAFIASLGGVAAVGAMSHEDRADALEEYMTEELDKRLGHQFEQQQVYPTVAQLEAQIETRNYRRGVGNLFRAGEGNVKKLPPMPKQPKLVDFFQQGRFGASNHVLQSANRALKTGMDEEIVLACLLHDVVQNLIKVDHGWWGAQIFEPYVPARTTFAIRYHQTLRFYPDEEAGYEYPEMYFRTFGIDYEPPEYIQKTYEMVKNHKMYMDARLVTVNDLYSFDANSVVTLDPFMEIIGRHFKQPKEGLGYDGSPVAHMWRTMINPDAPL
jgi:hypothetical protein